MQNGIAKGFKPVHPAGSPNIHSTNAAFNCRREVGPFGKDGCPSGSVGRSGREERKSCVWIVRGIPAPFPLPCFSFSFAARACQVFGPSPSFATLALGV